MVVAVFFMVVVARRSFEYRQHVARVERSVTRERLIGCPGFRYATLGLLARLSFVKPDNPRMALDIQRIFDKLMQRGSVEGCQMKPRCNVPEV